MFYWNHELENKLSHAQVTSTLANNTVQQIWNTDPLHVLFIER